MKPILLINILCLFATALFAQVTVLPISENWEVRKAGEEFLFKAEVPGTVYSDLYKNAMAGNQLKDFDPNMILKEDWEYRTIFFVDGDIIVADEIMLNFEGIYGKADVFLNDSLIFTSDNDIAPVQADVSEIIRRGNNTLKVYFHASDETPKDSFSSATEDCKFLLSSPGILKPIELKAWRTAVLNKVSIDQLNISKESATLLAHLKYESSKPFFGELEIKVDEVTVKKSTIDMRVGSGSDNITFTINDPMLWWPNGMGKQNLYSVEILLKKEGQTVDSVQIKTALRTVELASEEVKHTTSFYIKVNDLPVNLKAAVYNPVENFLRKNQAEITESILQSAAEANMNMIRLSDGGLFEHEDFYELCDQKGLLVWQNLVFAGKMNTEFEAAEISPAGSLPSDFSLRSIPDLKTLQLISESDSKSDSVLIRQYLDSPFENSNVAELISQAFTAPAKYPQYIYLCQLLQGEALSASLEAKRTDKRPAMGIVIPKLNDCRPAISESIIDYNGRKKAAYYFVKRALADVITVFETENETLMLRALSDLEKDHKAALIVELTNLSGKVLISEEKKIKLKAAGSEEIWKGSIKDLLKKQESDEVYLRAKLLIEDSVIAQNTYLFVPYKDLRLEAPEIKYDFIEKDGRLFITLKANKTAFGVYFESGELYPIFSDNYFTLDAKEEKTVEVWGDFESFELKNRLTVKSLFDIR